jgi:hypothetical protein
LGQRVDRDAETGGWVPRVFGLLFKGVGLAVAGVDAEVVVQDGEGDGVVGVLEVLEEEIEGGAGERERGAMGEEAHGEVGALEVLSRGDLAQLGEGGVVQVLVRFGVRCQEGVRSGGLVELDEVEERVHEHQEERAVELGAVAVQGALHEPRERLVGALVGDGAGVP